MLAALAQNDLTWNPNELWYYQHIQPPYLPKPKMQVSLFIFQKSQMQITIHGIFGVNYSNFLLIFLIIIQFWVQEKQPSSNSLSLTLRKQHLKHECQEVPSFDLIKYKHYHRNEWCGHQDETFLSLCEQQVHDEHHPSLLFVQLLEFLQYLGW